MLGRDEYRRAVAHWTELIEQTITWPDSIGLERSPFEEAPSRDALDDTEGMPSTASHRKFQIFVQSVGPVGGVANNISGTLRQRSITFNVVVAYLFGGGENNDEKEVRIVMAQDCEAIAQRLQHPKNHMRNSDGTGMVDVTQIGPADILKIEDRFILTIPFESQMQVVLEPAQGVAA